MGVGGSWVERRGFALRGLDDLAEDLGRGGLIEANLFAQVFLAVADGVEQAQTAESGDVRGVLGVIERDADVGLGTEVVDFVSFDHRTFFWNGWRNLVNYTQISDNQYFEDLNDSLNMNPAQLNEDLKVLGKLPDKTLSAIKTNQHFYL